MCYLVQHKRVLLMLSFFFVFSFIGLSVYAQACEDPFAQSPNGITTTQANLKWISDADTFEIELNQIGDTAQYAIVLFPNYVWTGLQPAAEYQYRVRAICNGNISSWSNLQPFRTHLTNPSNCFLNLDIPYSCNANNSFRIDVAGSGQALGQDVRLKEVRVLIKHTYDQDLILSLIAPDGTSIVLSNRNGNEYNNYGNPFDESCEQWTAFVDDACVPLITAFDASSNDLTNFVGQLQPEESLQLINNTGQSPNGEWQLKICDVHSDNFGTLEFAELIFSPISCVMPENLSVGEIGATSVDIEWSLTSVADSLYLEYSTEDFIPGVDANPGTGSSMMVLAGLDSTLLLTGLLPSTAYHVYLRSRCGNSFSDNVCLLFETNCADPFISVDFDTMTECLAKCNEPCPLTGVWQNIAGDGNDWVVHSGPTSSFQTGPDADVSGSGNYIYTETSYPCGNGAMAVLLSSCLLIGPNTTGCDFSFQRHMNGWQTGELRLLVHALGNSSWDTIWTQQGNQDDGWQKYYVDLSNYTNQTIQLRFEGIRGGSSGDIGLDELIFYEGIQDLGLPQVYYADVDGDGFGDANSISLFCASNPISGWVNNDLDCNDSLAAVYPDALEVPCNGLDENCNGLADDLNLPTPSGLADIDICLGTTHDVLLDNPSIGSYYWYSNGNLIAQGQNVSLSNLVDGQTIMVFDSVMINGQTCISDTIFIDVHVHDLPNIGMDSVIQQCQSVAFDVSCLVAEDINGQVVTTSFYVDVPFIPENELTENIFFPSSGGDLYIQGVTSFGCLDSKKIDFSIVPNPSVQINPALDTVELCPNGGALVQAIGSGGVLPYTYKWSNGFMTTSAFAQVDGAPGTYSDLSVIIEDSNGCVATDSLKVGNNGAILGVEIINLLDVSQCGGADGQFTVLPQGGVPPYTINWIGPVNGQVVTNSTALIEELVQGSYTLEITDSSLGACESTFSGIFINAPGLNVSLDTIKDVACHGGSNGAITLQVIGSNPSFTWLDGVNTQNRTNLPAGLYSVTVSDASCSLSFDNIEVLEPDSLNLLLAGATNVHCYNGNDGQIVLGAVGGVSPYTYFVDGSQSLDTLQNLSAAIYNCQVIDANACATELNVNISTPDSLGFVYEMNPVTCFGGSNGNLSVFPFGGGGPYTYSWDNPTLNGRVNLNLESGNYSVTITDVNGCTIDGDIYISSPDALVLNAVSMGAPTCVGLSDGWLVASASGGVGVLTYDWGPLSGNQLISGIAVGDYNLMVTDDLGCELDSVITLNADQVLTVNIDSISSISCNGMGDGYLAISVEGGQEPYNYDWNEMLSGNIVEGLNSGSYTVTITDNMGCVITLAEMQIMEPDSLILELSKEDILCYGQPSGNIYSVVNGGTAPYEYTWNTSTSNPDMLGIPEGSYSLTITDAHQCSASSMAEIHEPDSLIGIVQQVEMMASCYGGLTLGSIDLLVTGGVEPYAFEWSNGDSTQNISGLYPGVYNATLVDNNGCIVEVKPVSIYDSATDFDVVSISVEGINCNGEDNGVVVIEGQGGTLPYVFNWSNGVAGIKNTPFDTIQSLASGNYFVTITDAKGCVTISNEFAILEPDLLQINIDSIVNNPCMNGSQGKIFTTPSGGGAPYHYLWSTLSSEEDLVNLSAGDYFLTVTDDNDCITVLPDVITLTNLQDSFDIVIDNVVNQTCQSLGAIDISVVGNVNQPTFQWSNGAQTEDIDSLIPNVYSVTVTDENGCTRTPPDIVIGSDGAIVKLVVDTIVHISCYGASDGWLAVDVVEGQAPYQYFWSTNSSDVGSIDDLEKGTYSVTVVDANSCVSFVGGMIIKEPDVLLLESSEILDSKITMGGQILLNISGGTFPYKYFWCTSASSQHANPAINLDPGTYSVNILDANGCEIEVNNLVVGGVVGTEELTEHNVWVYPNPGDDFLTISYGFDLRSWGVWSTVGEKYMMPSIQKGNGLQLEIINLPSGIYVLVLADSMGERYVVRFSVIH